MKKKIILPIIAVVVLAGGLALASPLVARLIVKGGINYMNKKEEQEKEELVKIAESKEAREVLESILKAQDSEALTAKGKIKSYKIDKSRLQYNPMGGLIVYIIINENEKFELSTTLVENEKGKLEHTGWVISGELGKFLRGEKY